MRWTTGPLPAAVYWRRRALVVVGLLVVILLIANSCGGSGASEAAGRGTGTAGGSHRPSTVASSPGTLPSAPPSSSTVSGPPSSPPSGDPSPSQSATCADSEIKVAVRIESTSATVSRLQYGGTFSITMEVSNVSQRSCVRDVGTVAEEITVKQGSTTVWSSGGCGPTPGNAHELRTFHPGDLITAHVRWNSYRHAPSPCANAKTPARMGKYQLIARVGSDVSPAVTFTIEP
jgi:hypothetical protein